MMKTPQPTPAPRPPDPIRIPSPDDPDIKLGQKLKTQKEFADRKGRESTNLSSDYSRTTLG